MMRFQPVVRAPWCRVRRAGLWLGLVVLAGTVGCGGSGFGTSPLNNGSTRSRGAMDGFVFVPSRSAHGRQTAAGVSVPNALIAVYVMPRHAGDAPIATTQADDTGFYTIENLQLNVPLLVVATDPFDPQVSLSGVLSFGTDEATATKKRDLTPTSTVAAKALEKKIEQQAQQGKTAAPLSDSQVSALETVAEEQILGLGANAGVNLLSDAVLTLLSEQAAAASFGTLTVRIFSQPTATAQVVINDVALGSVQTAAPSDFATADENAVVVEDLPVGTAKLQITAPGFLTDELKATIVAGQDTTLDRTLVPQPATGQNQPPVIVTAKVTPQTLPFQGGTVTLDLVARDAENDAIHASATLFAPNPDTGAAGTAPAQQLDLTGSAGTFTGQFSIPGNSHAYNQTYVVDVEVDQGTAVATHRVLQFQVSGLQGPPEPPSEPSARLLVGRWLEQRSGATAEQLVAPTSGALVLTVNTDATFRVTRAGGTYSGTLVNIQPVSGQTGAWSMVMAVSQSSNSGDLPPAGSQIPLIAVLTANGTGLVTTMAPTTPAQRITEWARDPSSVSVRK